MKHKKAIEVVVMGSALVVSVGSTVLPMVANAADACSYSTTGTGATISGGATNFVKVDFAAKCSPNTMVKYADGGSAFALQGGSKKGNIVYGATSEGGGGVVWCGSPSTYSDAGAKVVDPTGYSTACM